MVVTKLPKLVSSSSGEWYINRPNTPIGMVSSYIISDGVSWNNKNPILVTCDSIGGLSIINANKMNVVAQYETFMADSDDTASTITNVGGTLSQLLQLLPLPSSSKNNPCNIGTLKYTFFLRTFLGRMSFWKDILFLRVPTWTLVQNRWSHSLFRHISVCAQY